MPRTENRVLKTLQRRDGSQIQVKMTPRQERFFDMLMENLGSPVEISKITETLDITVHNLRVTKRQVQEMIAGYYTIVSKWGQSYTIVQL